MNPRSTNGPLTFLGRLFLSAIFILSGLAKIGGFQATLTYMKAVGLPDSPALLWVAIGIEIVCGLMVLFGARARTGATILFLYLIPVTIFFQRFWGEPLLPSMNGVEFLKNLSIMGGLLTIAVRGSGAWSADHGGTEAVKRGEAEPRKREKAA